MLKSAVLCSLSCLSLPFHPQPAAPRRVTCSGAKVGIDLEPTGREVVRGLNNGSSWSSAISGSPTAGRCERAGAGYRPRRNVPATGNSATPRSPS